MRHFPLLFLSVNFLLLSFVVLFVKEVSAAPAVVGDNKRKTDYLPNKDNDNSNKLLENKTKNTADTKNQQRENLSGSESAAAVSSAPSTVDIAVNSGGYDDSGVDEVDDDEDDDNAEETFVTGDDTGQFTSSSSSSSALGDDYSNSLTSTNYHNNYHEPVNLDHLLYPVQTLYSGGFGGGGFGRFGGDAHYDHYSKSGGDHYGDHDYDHNHHSKQPDYKSDYKSGHQYHHQNHPKYHDKKHKEDHHDKYKGGGDGGGGGDHHKKGYHKKDDKNDDDQLANATRTVLRQRTRSLDGSVRCRVFSRLRERPSSLFYNRLTGRIRNRCRLRGVHVRNNFGRKRRRKYHHHHHHHYDDHDDDHYHGHYDHDDDNYYRR